MTTDPVCGMDLEESQAKASGIRGKDVLLLLRCLPRGVRSQPRTVRARCRARRRGFSVARAFTWSPAWRKMATNGPWRRSISGRTPPCFSWRGCRRMAPSSGLRSGGNHPPRPRHRRWGRLGRRGHRPGPLAALRSSRRPPAGTGSDCGHRNGGFAPRPQCGRISRPSRQGSSGVPVEVIDGAREAALTFKAVAPPSPTRSRRA